MPKVVLLGDEKTTDGPKRAGAVIEHPKADILVKLGKAVRYVEPEPLPAPTDAAGEPEDVVLADTAEEVADETAIEGEAPNASGEAPAPSED